MIKLVDNNKLSWLEQIVLYVALFSVFLMPSLTIQGLWFAVRVEDILFPIVLFILFRKRFFLWNQYTKLVSLFAFYIFLTIIINGRIAQVSDYFEIYKIIKYAVFLLFFLYVLQKNISLYKIFYGIFLLLIVFNFLHYINFRSFNTVIEPLYAYETQLPFFGVNSAGDPDTKRMLGTMGNPNNNAILFLFFASLFAPKKEDTWMRKTFFFIAVAAIISCQSRTGVIAFLVIYILNIILSKISLVSALKHTFIVLLIFFGISYFGTFSVKYYKLQGITDSSKIDSISRELDVVASSNTKYVGTMFRSDINKNTSVLGRIEVWQHLWKMIKKKPIFGYAPFKEYFYENNLYAENEYLLMMWRYGLIGLIMYAAWILLPFLSSIRRNKESVFLSLYTLVILIAATTNNPLTEPRILLMFTFAVATYYKTNNIADEKAAIDRY